MVKKELAGAKKNVGKLLFLILSNEHAIVKRKFQKEIRRGMGFGKYG